MFRHSLNPKIFEAQQAALNVQCNFQIFKLHLLQLRNVSNLENAIDKQQ